MQRKSSQFAFNSLFLRQNTRTMIKSDHHRRLQALKQYNLLESDFDEASLEAFNLLIESVALACQAPYGAIYLLQEKRYRMLSAYPHPPEDSGATFLKDTYYCPADSFFEIPDLSDVEEPTALLSRLQGRDIQYVAGCPFFDPNGVELGSILIFDRQPGERNQKQKNYLIKATRRLRQILLDRRRQQVSEVISLLFDSTDDYLLVTDLNGKILRSNSTFDKQLGLSHGEISGVNIFDLVHPDDRAAFRQNYSGNTQATPLFKFVTRLISSASVVRHVEWVGKSEESTGLRFYIGRDITGVEAQKLLLQNSERRFRAFLKTHRHCHACTI